MVLFEHFPSKRKMLADLTESVKAAIKERAKILFGEVGKKQKLLDSARRETLSAVGKLLVSELPPLQLCSRFQEIQQKFENRALELAIDSKLEKNKKRPYVATMKKTKKKIGAKKSMP